MKIIWDYLPKYATKHLICNSYLLSYQLIFYKIIQHPPQIAVIMEKISWHMNFFTAIEIDVLQLSTFHLHFMEIPAKVKSMAKNKKYWLVPNYNKNCNQ